MMQNLAAVEIGLFVKTVQFLQIAEVLQRCCDKSFFCTPVYLLIESFAGFGLAESVIFVSEKASKIGQIKSRKGQEL
jgi:hypothetical protein